MTTLARLGEAQRIERQEHRSVKFRWKVKDTDFGELFAELVVKHVKAGINYFTYERTTEDYFSVSLGNIEVEASDGVFQVERFTAFAGLGIARYEAGKRFSRKKLQEAAERALAEFTELYESGDERVLAYFSEDAEALHAAVSSQKTGGWPARIWRVDPKRTTPRHYSLANLGSP